MLYLFLRSICVPTQAEKIQATQMMYECNYPFRLKYPKNSLMMATPHSQLAHLKPPSAPKAYRPTSPTTRQTLLQRAHSLTR